MTKIPKNGYFFIKNWVTDTTVDTPYKIRGGCGQILGPCYFKLVPDFACTP